jgi:hypothetical protein
MKTNVELAMELENLVFNQKSFVAIMKVMSWHIDNNKSQMTPEQKVWAAFDFVVKPEFDRLSEHGLSVDTKQIITKMAYTKHEGTLKEFLILK